MPVPGEGLTTFGGMSSVPILDADVFRMPGKRPVGFFEARTAHSGC